MSLNFHVVCILRKHILRKQTVTALDASVAHGPGPKATFGPGQLARRKSSIRHRSMARLWCEDATCRLGRMYRKTAPCGTIHATRHSALIPGGLRRANLSGQQSKEADDASAEKEPQAALVYGAGLS